MASSNAGILHVSDTALMVAACRATETARPDALVRDPFAAALAGERGMAIARNLPGGGETVAFGVAIRSRFLDELIAQLATAGKLATVLSLGAGLDTRPWRLNLPKDLRWIEVDFPAMLKYKNAVMAAHPPRCHRQPVEADLNEAEARSAVFAAVDGTPSLLITEGLLPYLSAQTVEALVGAATGTAAIQHWLLDATSVALGRRVMRSYTSILEMRAADALYGEQILALLRQYGWHTVQHRSYTTDAYLAAPERVRALASRMSEAERPAPPPASDLSGIHLLGRTARGL
jgi:methyltransferase (TIGR00027 family)